MSDYSIALAGLQNTSSALDTVSNNISNANTVGYKAGEYLFADQFIKAVNPADQARVGMGTQSQGVRRAMTQGTINDSTNPLDMAVSGDGMFILSQNSTDPTANYYTRNGQFRLDSQGHIVNENGMYLMGFNLQDHTGGTLAAVPGSADTKLTLPPAQMFQTPTSMSTISTILDSRGQAFTSTSGVGFDPTQSTYDSQTTQTVYDAAGNTHTLDVYYRTVSSGTEAITYDATAKGWTYSPSASSTPYTLGTTKVTMSGQSVITVNTPPEYQDAAVSSSGTTLTLKNSIPASTINVGDHIYKNGVDTGLTVTAVGNSNTLTTSAALSVNTNDSISIYPAGATLNMTLTAPDGTQIPVTGTSNAQTAGNTLTAVTSKVEVYASFDGNFYNSTNGYVGTPSLTPQNSNNGGYKPIADLVFMGGHNIDGLIKDTVSGNPLFSTVANLSNPVSNPDGSVTHEAFKLDLTNTQMMASSFQVVNSVQDGQPASKLTNVTIDSAGRIIGVYGNGKQYFHQQVALIHFDNYEGLIPVGNNAFAASVASGTVGYTNTLGLPNVSPDLSGQGQTVSGGPTGGPSAMTNGVVVGTAGSGPFGDIKSMALESSNVDLANELVQLMVLQRAYSANSQSMRATDQTVQDALQMNR
jgi:flagellar hook protein FlgE